MKKGDTVLYQSRIVSILSDVDFDDDFCPIVTITDGLVVNLSQLRPVVSQIVRRPGTRPDKRSKKSLPSLPEKSAQPKKKPSSAPKPNPSKTRNAGISTWSNPFFRPGDRVVVLDRKNKICVYRGEIVPVEGKQYSWTIAVKCDITGTVVHVKDYCVIPEKSFYTQEYYELYVQSR